jgi:hypothetical protein
VSRWDHTPAGGDEVAFRAPFRYEGGKIEPGAVVLYHYVITVKQPRKLVAIQLPNEPGIKIAAITLEK